MGLAIGSRASVMRSLTIDHVSHAYGDLLAVDDVSLGVAAGELVCLVGPSGCGKSTLLRIAAGLERLQAGRVALDDRMLAEAGQAGVPPEERGIGLVFQDYALFPHLSVGDNVAFGLKGLSAGERRDRAKEVLARFGMAAQADAFPHVLSGGQQQRVALARALAPRPQVMLLDEPFSGLDSRLRDTVRDQALHVLKSIDAAVLMVTHDPEEAMFMADRIAVMREGRLEQVGTPAELYFAPTNAFVAEFFGEVNRLPGTVQEAQVETPLGTVQVDGLADGTAVEVLIRPEAVHLRRLADAEAASAHAGVVEAARLLGRSSLIHLSVARDGGPAVHLHARVPGRFLPSERELVGLYLDGTQAFVFPRTEGASESAGPE